MYIERTNLYRLQVIAIYFYLYQFTVCVNRHIYTYMVYTTINKHSQKFPIYIEKKTFRDYFPSQPKAIDVICVSNDKQRLPTGTNAKHLRD